MEWIMDPTAWAGLLTLVILEIVLGIDNLIFIAILAEKLPPHQRDKARVLGLFLALIMRLFLLATISWIATLTQPLFSLYGFSFSGRQLIMLIGGLFLLFKATVELNERLEGGDEAQNTSKKTVKFWSVIVQIVVLDAVFSLDSVITAVGMVNHLAIMMIAVTIAIMLMIIASKPLTRFVNSHPTIVILCLSFLLMIGFSLVAEGFGFAIPKGYLYAAIGFSILIEVFNQLAQANRRKYLTSSRSLRQRTAEAVLNILSGKNSDSAATTADITIHKNDENHAFNPQELRMIEQVMNFAQRSVGSIMTPRHTIENVNLDSSTEEILERIQKNQHSRIIVTNNAASDEPIGVINMIDLLKDTLTKQTFEPSSLVKQPLIFPENISLLVALEQFKKAKTHFAFVVDEFGSVEGVVTLTDVMETIAGDLPIDGEAIDARYDITQTSENCWIANGYIPLEDLKQHIPINIEEKREYHTLAGLLMEHSQNIPAEDEQLTIDNWCYKILKVNNHRILSVEITPQDNDES